MKKLICTVTAFMLMCNGYALADDVVQGMEYMPDGTVEETTEPISLVGQEVPAVKNYLEEHKNDVIKTDKTLSESVEDLASIGILKGFPDGDYRTNENVTRAQMVAFINRFSNPSKIAAADISETDAVTAAFTDLTADYWAINDIATAYANNRVNGYEDNTFKAENEVTYLEALKMILTAMNYDVLIADKGGYPDGVIYWANDLQLIADTDAKSDTAATRGDIILMLSKALDSPIADSIDENCLRTETVQKSPLTMRQYLDINNYIN